MLELLKPMFDMDFYLPRSFMAVLKFDKLHVVKSKVFPPEVTLAVLYFFFKTDYFDSDHRKKVCSLHNVKVNKLR